MRRTSAIPLASATLLLAALCSGLPPGWAEEPPHPRGAAWLDRSGADFHGHSPLACEDCHELGRECATCHFGPEGSRVSPGSRWRHGRSGHEGQGAAPAVCTRCHALSRSLGHGPGRCHDCHGEGGEGEREQGHRRGARERGREHHEREHDD